MIKLIDLIREDSQASRQAKQLGLVSKGWGRWADPNTGNITHKTVGGRLVLITGRETSVKSTPKQKPSGGITGKFRKDLEPLLRGTKKSEKAALADVDKKWRGEMDSPFGPPPKDAPRAKISPSKSIVGRVQDMTLDGIGDIEEFYESTTREPSVSKKDGVTTEKGISEKIKTDVGGLLKTMKDLDTWQDHESYSKRHKEAVAARNRFFEYAQGIVSPRIGLGTPVVRGIAVDPRVFETVMNDYQIGGTVTFDEPFSFSTEGMQMDQFTGDGPTKLILRIHPGADKKHAGVYIPNFRDAFYNATTDHIDENPDIDSELEDAFYDHHDSDYDSEGELLITPGIEYEVTGLVRATDEGGSKIIMVDLIEKAQTNEEQNQTKTINKITKSYLNRPLDIRKIKKGSNTGR